MDLRPNDPCHCGSTKKYKKCCYHKDLMAAQPDADIPEPDAPPTPLDPEFEELLKGFIERGETPAYKAWLASQGIKAIHVTDGGLEVIEFPKRETRVLA